MIRDYFKDCEAHDWDSFYWRGYFFAEASALAYHDEKMGAKQYKKVGFGNHRFLDKDGAQCHIAWDSDHMIIAFRGTEPDQMSDVKADLLAIKRKSKTEGRVHLGFKLELRKLWVDLMKILNVHLGDKTLWICGHSLGGAMATLCASRLEEKDPILYTYGSPKVGGKEFVAGLEVDHWRFVNNNDAVPKVPLWLMGYRHHGHLQYINYGGMIKKCTYWQRWKDGMRGRWRAICKFQLFDGIYDHDILKGYSDRIKKLI